MSSKNNESFIARIVGGEYNNAVHFGLSLCITAVLLLIAAPWVALIGAFVIGLLKELSDAYRGGSIGYNQLAVNVLGIAAAYLLWALLIRAAQ